MADGKTDKKIANALGISERTVVTSDTLSKSSASRAAPKPSRSRHAVGSCECS